MDEEQAATEAEIAWAKRLARVLLDKPESVDLFFRAGFKSITAQVTTPRDDEDGGQELDAKEILSVRIGGADCGDP